MKERTPIVILLIVTSLLMFGCSTIRTHNNLEQPTGSVLTTGIGGIIFRLNKTGDLPNAFGGRDIWGGKVDKGFAEMKLAGIEGAVLLLAITDVSKHSTETTMDRYKVFENQNESVDVDTTVIVGNQEQLRPYIVRFDTNEQRDIVIGGVRVNFSEVQPYSVQYSLTIIQP